MQINNMIKTFEDWLEAEKANKHSMAVKYIEENIDLVDIDLHKFMDNCPKICEFEVYEMLLKAGIDMTEYIGITTLKKFDKMYIHDSNFYSSPYYTFDCRETLNKYIEETVTLISNFEQEWEEA